MIRRPYWKKADWNGYDSELNALSTIDMIHLATSGGVFVRAEGAAKGRGGLECQPKEEGGEALNQSGSFPDRGEEAPCSVLFPFRIAPLCAL